MRSKASRRGDGLIVPRAQRYSVEVPIRFRAARDSAWRDGRTANVSRTGVLFLCEHNLRAGTRVKLGFRLPSEILGHPAARVECNAIVVRALPPSASEADVSIAAAISSYRLARAKV